MKDLNNTTLPSERGNGFAAKFAMLLCLALAACCEETPAFVRFERNEMVAASVARSHYDNCRAHISMAGRSYSATLDPEYCRAER